MINHFKRATLPTTVLVTALISVSNALGAEAEPVIDIQND